MRHLPSSVGLPKHRADKKSGPRCRGPAPIAAEQRRSSDCNRYLRTGRLPRNAAVLGGPDLRVSGNGQDQHSDVTTSHCWITSFVDGSRECALGMLRAEERSESRAEMRIRHGSHAIPSDTCYLMVKPLHPLEPPENEADTLYLPSLETYFTNEYELAYFGTLVLQEV